MAQTTKSKVEQLLSRAHHVLYLAYAEAATLRTDDLADEIWSHLREVERLQSALLKS